jgi:flap endonuclease-1
MGIKQLFQIIQENAPDAVKTGEIKNHFGRKVAIVGLQIWQFGGVIDACRTPP